MAIGVMTAEKGGEATSPLKAVSHLSLEEPTDVTLGPDAGAVAGYAKQGGDLHLRMENGEILYIRDFFTIGEDGDFSRLISPTGEPLVTGLMAPEPEDLNAVETTGVFADQPSSDTSASDTGNGPEIPPPGSERSGGDMGSVLVGAGLPLGAGISLYYAEDDEGPVAGTEAPASEEDAAAFAADVDALTHSEGEDAVIGEDDALPEENAEAGQGHGMADPQVAEAGAEGIETDGGFVETGFTDMELLLSDPAPDLLSELTTESAL